MATERPPTITVVLVDDHPVVRDGLRSLINSVEDAVHEFRVVGEGATGREAIALAVELAPRVMVMDLQMPDLGGVEATREIARVAPTVGVLVLTMFEDDDNVYDALVAGARGYVVKGATQEEIVRAIVTVAVGGAVFGTSIANRVLSQVNRAPSTLAAPFPALTAREREVLDLLAAGLPNAAIAARLDVSAKTVGNHLSTVYMKLRVEGRAQAMVAARDAGLGRESQRPGPR